MLYFGLELTKMRTETSSLTDMNHPTNTYLLKTWSTLPTEESTSSWVTSELSSTDRFWRRVNNPWPSVTFYYPNLLLLPFLVPLYPFFAHLFFSLFFSHFFILLFFFLSLLSHFCFVFVMDSIISWNIANANGLLGRKTDDPEFVKIIKGNSIICLQETGSEVTLPGYESFSNLRKTGKGGGVKRLSTEVWSKAARLSTTAFPLIIQWTP